MPERAPSNAVLHAILVRIEDQLKTLNGQVQTNTKFRWTVRGWLAVMALIWVPAAAIVTHFVTK